METSGFSIRYKILILTSALVVACVGAYLQLATWEFRQDKTEWVFDYNRSLVTNLSSDIESLFRSVEDKMRLVAYFYRARDQRSLSLVHELLASSSDLVFVGGSDSLQSLDREFYVDLSFVETYGLPENYFSAARLFTQKPIPFDRLRLEGEVIWNATEAGGPPLIGFAKNVIEEGATRGAETHYAVIGVIQASKIISSLDRPQLNEIFVLNHQGEILAHPSLSQGQEREVQRQALLGLVTQAQRLRVPIGVMTYQEGEEQMLGAFARILNDKVVVLSRISEQRAFAAVDQLQRRSILFAMVVVSLAFLAAVIFSRSLTRPIETLLAGTKKVAEGDLTSHIAVDSRDEMAILSRSFNKMMDDLRASRNELEEINRDLEQKVASRTHQLEQQNQAVKRAQEALLRTTRLAAAGEIAGRAAHEVLNPLTAILTRLNKVKERLESQRKAEVQLLGELAESWGSDYAKGGFPELVHNWKSPSAVDSQKTLWEEDLDNLKHIHQHFRQEWEELNTDSDFLLKASQRINRIVQSMRSLSVVRSDLKAHSLYPLVQESVHIMADLAAEEGLELNFEKDESLLPDAKVLLDGDEFIQSLTNLLRNAIQAVAAQKRKDPNLKGEVRVKVEFCESEQKYQVWVQDNGLGILPEHQSQLFENQFTTKSPSEGTGLGLNISRRFIRAFGGDIYLHSSQLGQGSLFVIEVPSQDKINQKQEKVSA